MRRLLERTEIDTRLNRLGWELPKGVSYKGMLEVHTVKCLHCDWIQEKRLDNLIYREERCNHCGTPIKLNKTLGEVVGEFNMSIEELKQDIIQTIQKTIERMMENHTKPDKAVIEKSQTLKKAFQRYISRVGFKKKRRKLTSDEWHDLSHHLAEEIMKECAVDEDEFYQWEQFYIDLLEEHPKKQGQDILPAVIPVKQHHSVADKIRIKTVKL